MKGDLYKLVLIKLTHNLKRVFKNYQNLKGELMRTILNPMPNPVPTLWLWFLLRFSFFPLAFFFAIFFDQIMAISCMS